MGSRPANRGASSAAEMETRSCAAAATEMEGLPFVAGSEAGVTGTMPRGTKLVGAIAGTGSSCREGLGTGLGPCSSCEPAGLRRTSRPGRRLSVVVHSTPAARHPRHDGSCWSQRTFLDLPGEMERGGQERFGRQVVKDAWGLCQRVIC